jgi:hypothetical protein
LSEVVDKFSSKVDTVKDDEIFRSGAKKNRGLVGELAIKDFKSNTSQATNLGKLIPSR